MSQLTTETTSSWKTKLLITGALAGALLGLATAYLLARTAEENKGGPPAVNTVDALKASIGLIGIIRSIAALGDGK
ncbi:MAG: hypothetical protein H6662_10005 [Ardenticatenaceae bacterium]|nr:hypothetical protein [Anaerolineales bacterium]MCB8921908.1 hypothetical protein [Ardenticatenaceae bacterium]MCB8989483.1 hypothetical protein [Ardenticatenaceae bacterium]